MKYPVFLYSCVLMLLNCSTSNDVAVTQTGNPTQVSLLIKADTMSVTDTLSLPKTMASDLVIEHAYMVVYKVEMEPIDGTEFVLFQGPNPYVIELVPGGGTGMVDSTLVAGNNSYESIEMEFGPLNDTLSLPLVPDSLKGQSIFVEGHFGTDSLSAFTFTSNISESLEYPFDSTLVLPSSKGAEILVKVRINDWFRDSIGALIDPRDQANRAAIEKNITGSVDVEEDTDSEETEEIQ